MYSKRRQSPLLADASRALDRGPSDGQVAAVASLRARTFVITRELQHSAPIAEGDERERLPDATCRASSAKRTNSAPPAQLVVVPKVDLAWSFREALA
jgi:hypothetical protein